MKASILIARVAVNRQIRSEIADWLVNAAIQADSRQDIITDVFHTTISQVPTSVARNQAIQFARQKNCDILFQLDDDMSFHPEFFIHAVEFLMKHQGPAAIGCPYVTSPPHEGVNVFRFASSESNGEGEPLVSSYALERYSREEAALRTGTEEVANLGTGCIAYRMDCFEKIDHPYHDYSYADETRTKVIETEDCYVHRKLYFAGVPLYVSWDHWADHWKIKRCSKPVLIPKEAIPDHFMKAARAELKVQHQKELKEALTVHAEKTISHPPSVPTAIEGWSHFTPLYNELLESLPANSSFIEVGLFCGKSLIHAARKARELNKPIRFWGVDHFQGNQHEPWFQQRQHLYGNGKMKEIYLRNLKAHGVDKDILTLDMPSVEASKRFLDNNLDFVFLDASHDYESVKQDILAWWPKVKEGGILAGDDIEHFPGVKTAVRELFGTGYEVRHHAWVVTKKPGMQLNGDKGE